MSGILDQLRGITAKVAAYIPGAGQLIQNLDSNDLRVGDGTTLGGWIIGGLPITSVTGTTYTVGSTNQGQLLVCNNSSGIAVSLPQAGVTRNFPNGAKIWVLNEGAGNVTITPTTSTINSAASIVLQPNSAALISSDGTNYWAIVVSSPNVSLSLATKTSNYTVLATDNGIHFDNQGASGAVTFSLPAAAAGRTYSFAVFASQTLEVLAHSGDLIAYGNTIGSTGGNLSINTPYSFVTIEAHSGGVWLVTSMVGNWNLT